MSGETLLDRLAGRDGDVALIEPEAGRRVTYGELDARSNALAHTLVKNGVERGDRVILYADNTVECVVSFWAVLRPTRW